MLAEPTTMARKKRNDLAAKIEADLVIKARTMVSYWDNTTVAEYLSKILRPVIEKDFERFKRELGESKERRT